MGAIAAGALGLAMGGAGAFLKGKAGDITRNRLNSIADTPGIDTGALTGQSLSDIQKYLPQASEVARQTGLANQSTLSAMEEQALPGTQAARLGVLGNANALISGRLPQGVIDELKRHAAASNLGTFGASAFGGPSIGNANTARQLGLGTLGGIQLGTGMLGNLLAGLRIANSPSVANFFGPNPNELINLRSSERAQSMGLRAQAAGIPGMTSAFGSYLSSTGGMLAGAGMTGMVGGMGGGGGMSGGSPYFAPNGAGYTLPSNYGSLGGNAQSTYLGMLNNASTYTGPTE